MILLIIFLGPVPNISKSHFDELLDPGLFTKKEDEGPVPLKEMKRKNEIEKSVDPERAKVMNIILVI